MYIFSCTKEQSDIEYIGFAIDHNICKMLMILFYDDVLYTYLVCKVRKIICFPNKYDCKILRYLYFLCLHKIKKLYFQNHLSWRVRFRQLLIPAKWRLPFWYGFCKMVAQLAGSVLSLSLRFPLICGLITS